MFLKILSNYLFAFLLALFIFSVKDLPAQESPIETDQSSTENNLVSKIKDPLIVPDQKDKVERKPLDEEFYDLKTLIHDYDSNNLAIRAVERHINTFTTRLRDRFAIWLSRAGMYIDIMKEILVQNGLPKELVFLPLIESGFNTNAYSRARAVGPWQFIASTARKYGLTINWWIDERRDPIKSTEAAARYLKDLYDMFNSWHLAMAAYNAGEGKVMRALRKTRTEDHWTLLQKKTYLRRETREYVPKFIAASLIALEPEKYGFEDIDYHEPVEFTEVEIESPVDLEIIAKAAETDLQTIRLLNPELKRWCTPPDQPTYIIRIPAEKKEIFLQNLEKIPKEKRYSYRIHRVRKGETVSKIAKRYGIQESVIYALNPEIKGSDLKPEREIKIPPEGFKPDPDDLKKKRRTYRKKNPSA
ncbi:MAG: transglycosylase SLT domain-containing protein [Thermodesulfovibrionales bacterium]|nr:transglycosylase SLT domain-containing protein [Thermodesulfovibrionales bacterium]